MTAIRIRKTLDSATLHLPELQPLIGRTVEITVEEQPSPAVRDDFYRVVGCFPATEKEWESRRELFRSWRVDPDFEAYWPMLDHLLTVDFDASHRWAAAAEVVRELTDYDFDAWRDQREFDRLHSGDRRP